ncbi:MAG TPA: TM0106 family RecB-like putative nuclease [Acidimicrobiales bacterium]|nr:TM0106 family RecB-like putative nuclease [Acidimicrobiales bacterium]
MVTSLLRGAEIDACVHRITLARAEPTRAHRTPLTPEIERRRHEADQHRRNVLERLIELHPRAITASSQRHTEELMTKGAELILNAQLADARARRTVTSQAFVRVGRVEDRFTYAPLVIKNHEVTEAASTRQLVEGSLDRLVPGDVVTREGLGLRSTSTVRRDVLLLDGATRILQAFGAADSSTRGALVDRNSRLWWLDLANPTYSRSNLKAYDVLYRERVDALNALDGWFEVGGAFPTSPYWHRECLTCEFSEHCKSELEDVDDVSLTRFTSLEQQVVLRDAGVRTRRQLALLDPVRARTARAKSLGPDVDAAVEDRLARKFDRLDELIYRARSHSRDSALRILDPSLMGCPVADVEVDVDMESYDDATYLWGAYVTLNELVDGITEGYTTFVEWGELTPESEARNFASFWTWLTDLREVCRAQGRSFAAYCFWAQAEDGAMNRAVATAIEGGPTPQDLDEFRQLSPPVWIDLHDLAKVQIQTEGPLGLKQLAVAAGFKWRDVNPSGEASMLWYEVAAHDEEADAMVSRQRILDYNEDDCRATKRLRDWLNGAAKSLAHRDDPL